MRSPQKDQDGTQTISGLFTGAGVVVAGADFTITRTGVGLYTINFLRPFRGIPIVTAEPAQGGALGLAVTSSGPTSAAVSVFTTTTGVAADGQVYFSARGRAA